MEAMLTGFASIAQVDLLLVMLAAVLLGSFFGIVPGLGGTVGLALTIPFLFGVEPIYGIVFLVSMHAVVHTGASIPAILFGVPGTSPTAATILDGHPMAEQGLSLIHISEPTRLRRISYAVFCLKKKK